MLTGLPNSGGTMGPMAPLVPLSPAALPRDSNADPRVVEIWLFLFLVSVFYVYPNRKKKRKIQKIPNKVETNRMILFFQVLTKVEFKMSCKVLTSKFQIRYLGFITD